jgi:hypothetical protein
MGLVSAGADAALSRSCGGGVTRGHSLKSSSPEASVAFRAGYSGGNAMKRAGKALLLGGAWILALMLAFALVEGGASTVIFVHDFFAATPSDLAERRHTAYDAHLGWANLPNTVVPDMYGEGIGLRINNLGFRATRPTTVKRAAGTKRAVCSGDSFTLGYGVADDETWCHLLGTLTPRLETVNMGQGGYGVDQVYLWYMRDGRQLDHDIHIVALITSDLERMTSPSFLGYGKPLITIEDGKIAVQNVPVPRSSGRAAAARRQAVSDLRASALLQKVRRRFAGDRPAPDIATRLDSALGVAIRLFEDLKSVNDQKKSALFVVWLPTRGDHGSTRSDAFRARLAREMSRRGIPFVDLVEPFRSLASERVNAMFIAAGQMEYTGAAGHYSAAGNQWTARMIRDRLTSDGALAGAVDSRPSVATRR